MSAPPAARTPLAALRELLDDPTCRPGAVVSLVEGLRDPLDVEAAGRRLARSGRLGALAADAGFVPVRVALLANSTIDELDGLLTARALTRRLAAQTHSSGFDQWQHAVRDGDSPLHAFGPQVTVCLLDDRAVLGSAVEALTVEDLAARCRRFVADVRSWLEVFAAGPGGIVVMPTIPLSPAQRGRWIGLRERAAVEAAWSRMNAALAETAADSSTLVLLSAEELIMEAGVWAAGDRVRHIASRTYSTHYLDALARQVCAVAAASLGRAAKCLVLDLDDTTWSGTVAELGPQGLSVGGAYPGSAHAELQALARDYAAQGVVLAVCSKNDEATALAAMSEVPTMLLRPDSFASMRINWEPKATNLREIAAELDLGSDSLVFVDDSPGEREQMRAFAPEVVTVDVGPDPAGYAPALRRRGDFWIMRTTAEDARRTELYRVRAERHRLAEASVSHEDYLRSLGTRVEIMPADGFTRDRLAQLFGKTNQFNLTGARYTVGELVRRGDDGSLHAFGVRLTDRFGDAGLVCALALRDGGDTWLLENMVLSCRVFGRDVETAVVRRLLDDARAAAVRRVGARFVATDRNTRFEGFLAGAGFVPDADLGPGGWRHDLDTVPDLPEWITFTGEGSFRAR